MLDGHSLGMVVDTTTATTAAVSTAAATTASTVTSTNNEHHIALTVAAAPTSIITLNYTITLQLGKTGYASAASVNSAVLTLITQVQ